MKQQERLEAFQHFLTLTTSEVEKDEVDAWVEKLQLVQFQPKQIILGGLTQFFCNFVQNHHFDLLKKNLRQSFQSFGLEDGFLLTIQVSTTPKFDTDNKIGTSQTEEDKVIQFGLNPQFIFEKFVSGGNSDIAFAAAQSVGENIKDNKYNPLFICGDVGLGKTHLIQAIGFKALESHQNLKIRYASSKEFINEVIDGIRFGKIQQVRKKYSQVDILMIDDIQFLENKESTQEEFFHIFNGLIQNNKQVVLTSDRYPREIKNLEERLVNRFNSGMVARIYPPDFETRVAIIQTKVFEKQLPIPEEIVNFLANAIKSNVRDIEGILIQIEANYSLLGQEINIENTKRILREVLNLEEDNPRTIENIIKLVSQKFDVKISDLKSDKRTKEISKPRQIAMFICKEVTSSSYPAIAKHFGGKNHTTVMQAYKKTKEWIEEDPEIKQSIQTMIRELSL